MRKAGDTSTTEQQPAKARRRAVFFVAVLVLGLLAGIAGTAFADLDLPMIEPSDVNLYNNANVSDTYCTCSPPATWPTLCDYEDESNEIKEVMLKALEEELMATANQLEIYIGDHLIDGMMQAFLTKLNNNETNLIDWWDTFWFYNFYPALQDLAEAVITAQEDQLRSSGASVDAGVRQEQEQKKQVENVDDERDFRPSEDVCVMATTAGGQGSASNISKAFQNAWEQEARQPGLNKLGTPGATGRNASEAMRHSTYENTFCDPNDNNGHNTCTSASNDPKLWNADVQATKFLFDAKTIPVDADARYGKAVQALVDNMMGTTSDDPVPPDVAAGAEGQEKLLQRRSFLARYALVRSVPQMIAGWIPRYRPTPATVKSFMRQPWSVLIPENSPTTWFPILWWLSVKNWRWTPFI